MTSTEVTTCPRPDCPNPTLHISKSGAKYHCIGCWRQFTQFTRTGKFRVVQQKPPAKRWLRKYSPERLHGPPPELVNMKLPIRLPLTRARREPSTPPPRSIAAVHTESLPAASIAMKNADSYTVISVSATSSEEEEDDDISTARYDGATQPSSADSQYVTGPSSRFTSPSSPDIDEFPAWYSGATSPTDTMFSYIADSRYVAGLGPSRKSRSLSFATPATDNTPNVNYPQFGFLPPTSITARDEDCESTGSSPDPGEVIPAGSSIVRALKLIHGRRKFSVCCGRSSGIRTGVMMCV